MACLAKKNPPEAYTHPHQSHPPPFAPVLTLKYTMLFLSQFYFVFWNNLRKRQESFCDSL
jgi:hypothetical protein